MRVMAYTKAELERLRQRVIAQTQERVLSISHIMPRAYCVAKPASHMAVFVVPPMDREPQVRNDEYTVVHNETCRDVRAGQWCSLAYVSTKHYGQSVVILDGAQ